MRLLNRLLVVLCLGAVPAFDAARAVDLVQETPAELITTVDLNGDGLRDVVLADKRTGRIRPAYQQPGGTFKWVDWRESGVRDLTGLSVGAVLNAAVVSRRVSTASYR